jgi:hypothetical protein
LTNDEISVPSPNGVYTKISLGFYEDLSYIILFYLKGKEKDDPLVEFVMVIGPITQR